MTRRCPDYIVVEGPIGVGKTTLAKRLAETFGTDLMLELVEENPFLPRFYMSQKTAALPTQLYFLFQRVKQIETLRQTDMFRPLQIADFLLEKDQIFAHITLDDDELSLYQQIYKKLAFSTPKPNLVIYLQAPVETLMRRIHARNIAYEKNIDRAYLQRVVDAYVDFFYRYNRSSLLIVNTNDFDLADGVQEYNLLLEQIQNAPLGRHYFNPKEIW